MDLDWRNILRGKTITLEFYIDGNRQLHVICNHRDYPFPEFWHRYENAEAIGMCIDETFREQYPRRYTLIENDSRDWRDNLIRIINAYLRSHDRQLDVMIKSNGIVTYSLEH